MNRELGLLLIDMVDKFGHGDWQDDQMMQSAVEHAVSDLDDAAVVELASMSEDSLDREIGRIIAGRMAGVSKHLIESAKYELENVISSNRDEDEDRPPDTANMKVICAWCGKVKKEGTGPVSHGICKDCQTKLFESAGVED